MATPAALRLLRRQVNRLRARLRPPALDFVYGRAYRFEWPGMPFDEVRGERVLTALVGEGLVRPAQVLEPTPATYQEIRRVHDDTYLDSITRPEVVSRIFGATLDEAAVRRVLELQRAMVGGTTLAVRRALATRRPVVNLGGGFHHAGRATGAGFCLFNDLAVALAVARADGFAGRVLIIDLDLHDGDGTREIFAEDPLVHTLSIHNHDWREIDAVAATVVPLGDTIGDAPYLAAVDAHVPRLLREHEPDLVLYLAGTDPAFDDPIGNWKITDDGLFARDRRVFEAVAELAPSAALVVLLAGGYGLRTWRFTARALAWYLTGRDRFVAPSNEELTLRRYRDLARLLDPAALTGDDDPFRIRPEDIYPAFAVTQPRRFLGYYAPDGLELALERYGLFERLRARGFRHLALSVSADDPARQVLRIRDTPPGEPARLLIELQVHRDRGIAPDAEVLAVDWLLLQNPRRPFAADQPQLPGQKHPGLGLFTEVVGLLVMACERLRLDGLAVVPSHYHLAVHWRRNLLYLDPVADARFSALQAALAGLPLADAARALAEGRVWDDHAQAPVAYQPAPMLLPLSDALRARLDADAPAYQARRAAALADLRYRLRPPTT